ncbi:MAG: HD-GYP domain-containing protein [Chloroflexi bacterium]|nr:HD-GYP domain-containing protein [Chloroflexota bacterium]
MTRSLGVFIAGAVAWSAFALLATALVYPIQDGIAPWVKKPDSVERLLGVTFWVAATLFASALPVRMPRGTVVSVSIAPIVATMILGGPAAATWVAALGTTEWRELRGRVPWYGSLANHAALTLPAAVGGVAAFELHRFLIGALGPAAWTTFVATVVGAAAFFVLNVSITSAVVSLRSGQTLRVVLFGDARGFWINFLALAPLAWLMAQVYTLKSIGWLATLLFALPLYTTRVANRQFVEMREMFTQTISSLAQAVDKRDKYTSGHSLRVKEIAVDIGREMRVGDQELEALEWGGLLHDVGKIGVADAVLLKQERLTREERMLMNAHPVLGAEIIAPVTKLAPELPIIRHHHEWYNGSGYPDRLIGDEIPKLARVLHVADAFEAMTAARPYRMKPLTAEQALGELRKFAGIQFDPAVVDAFVKTKWVDGVDDPGRDVKPRPVPLISQAAGRISQASALSERPSSTPDLR